MDDLTARRKKRGGGLDKEATGVSTTTEKTSEEGLGPDTTRNIDKEMKATTGKDMNVTSTTETPLPQNEEDDDDEDVVTSCPILEEARTTKSASHMKARSGKKPTVTKSKTMPELDAEAKRAAARKKDESQGVRKTEAIRKQRLAEEAHDTYLFDDDEEYEKYLYKERFAEHFFQLRAGYPEKELMEKLLVLL